VCLWYTEKLGPIGSENITPPRERIIISYEDKDQIGHTLIKKNEVTNSVLEICLCVLFMCL
jgi:hypothetical protein